MAVSIGRRLSVLAGVIAGALALVVPVSPASAQIPPGAQATPIVGGPTANCPPGSPGAVVAVQSTTVNGVTVYGPAGGQCAPLAATTSGEYSIAGVTSGPLRFNAACANSGGTVATNGFVDVPAGSTVNGVVVNETTPVTALNATVVYPGGRTATVNQVTTTPTSVTRNAIVFAGGPTVGQVVCGTVAAYPLVVETASGASPAPLAPLTSSGDNGGISTTLLVAGAIALALAAQLIIGRRVWRQNGHASG